MALSPRCPCALRHARSSGTLHENRSSKSIARTVKMGGRRKLPREEVADRADWEEEIDGGRMNCRVGGLIIDGDEYRGRRRAIGPAGARRGRRCVGGARPVRGASRAAQAAGASAVEPAARGSSESGGRGGGDPGRGDGAAQGVCGGALAGPLALAEGPGMPEAGGDPSPAPGHRGRRPRPRRGDAARRRAAAPRCGVAGGSAHGGGTR